jgi:putative glutamine amidotransferase
MKKPIIGIVLDHSTKKLEAGGYANFPWYALRSHYAQAVTAAGGVPIFIPYETKAIKEYLNLCHGLIFPGGDVDIHPSLYREKISVKRINLDANSPRAKFELKLIKAALKTKIPILGICAGFQALNVALGGSLYQDISEQTKTTISHSRSSSNNSKKNSHSIAVTKGTLLDKITGKTNYTVNSFHHQTVKKLGKNLKASAVSPDGLIEAIELAKHPFCIGVEWHPEFLETIEDKRLFKAMISAAKKYN